MWLTTATAQPKQLCCECPWCLTNAVGSQKYHISLCLLNFSAGFDTTVTAEPAGQLSWRFTTRICPSFLVGESKPQNLEVDSALCRLFC